LRSTQTKYAAFNPTNDMIASNATISRYGSVLNLESREVI
jgi:hypothetical protein